MSILFAILLISCVSKSDYCKGEAIYVRLPYSAETSSIRASDYCGNEGVDSTYTVGDSTFKINCKCKVKDVE